MSSTGDAPAWGDGRNHRSINWKKSALRAIPVRPITPELGRSTRVRVAAYRKFSENPPRKFAGDRDTCVSWIHEMEAKFVEAGVHEEWKVRLTERFLRGEASHWWFTVRHTSTVGGGKFHEWISFKCGLILACRAITEGHTFDDDEQEFSDAESSNGL